MLSLPGLFFSVHCLTIFFGIVACCIPGLFTPAAGEFLGILCGLDRLTELLGHLGDRDLDTEVVIHNDSTNVVSFMGGSAPKVTWLPCMKAAVQARIDLLMQRHANLRPIRVVSISRDNPMFTRVHNLAIETLRYNKIQPALGGFEGPFWSPGLGIDLVMLCRRSSLLFAEDRAIRRERLLPNVWERLGAQEVANLV